MTSSTTVVFDLDSTLADTRHRRQHLPEDAQGPADWIDYHSHCLGDAPIAGRIQLAYLLSKHHRIVIITARPNTPAIHANTHRWLDRHQVPRDDVILLPLDETRSPSEWKTEVVEKLISDGADVVLAVDDWWATGTALEELGVPFLHVARPYTPGTCQAQYPMKITEKRSR
jgi:hypothetical protein